MPPGVVAEAALARFDYADLDRYADVHRRLLAVEDSAALLDSAYLGRAGLGLEVHDRLYDVTAASLLNALRAYPARYHAVATRAPIAARALEGELRAAFDRLEALYPDAIFPPVHYLAGAHQAGGAVQIEGVLIAVELLADPDPLPGRSLADLVPLVVHELVHYQQAAVDPARYQAANTLLERAVKEGGADFVAELVTGRHTNPAIHAYGLEHEWDLWRRFRCSLAETATGDWFFRTPADRAMPANLGYFIGYRIVAHRYAREADPAAALATVLRRAIDARALLEESGYETALERRAGRRFPACAR